MIIQQPNPNTSSLPKSYLSTSIGAVTSIPVKNINSFTSSYAIQIGETGEEQTEIQVLSASTPSGTALSIIGTTVYSHPTDTPIYPIVFDKLIFKKSTSGTIGTAIAISGGTIPIQPDQNFTQFEDIAGDVSFTYKTAFYNSVLMQSSDDSDWILPAGPSQYSLVKLRGRIRDKLFNSAFVSDDTINDWINEWKDVLTNTAIKVNKDYALGSTTISFNTGISLGTITASDYRTIRRIWMVDNSGTYKMGQMDTSDFTPDQNFSNTTPRFSYQGDTVIYRNPYDYAGTAQILYSKLNSNLQNDNDELPSPMKGYTKSFIDYCMAQAYMKDNNQKASTPFMQLAENERLRFEREITPRHESGPEYVKIVDQTGEEEGYYYM